MLYQLSYTHRLFDSKGENTDPQAKWSRVSGSELAAYFNPWSAKSAGIQPDSRHQVDREFIPLARSEEELLGLASNGQLVGSVQREPRKATSLSRFGWQVVA